MDDAEIAVLSALKERPGASAEELGVPIGDLFKLQAEGLVEQSCVDVDSAEFQRADGPTPTATRRWRLTEAGEQRLRAD